MGIKGDPLTGLDDPRVPSVIRNRWAKDRAQAWVEAENAKWEVVDTCDECNPPHPLSAQEVGPHKLTHIRSGRARQIIGMIFDPKTTPEALEEIKAALK